MSGLARLLAGHPWRALLAAALLSVLALLAAGRLHLDTDLTSLLPEGSPAAADYRVFLERFGGFEKVFVIVEALPGETEGDPGPRATRAARRLEELLAASPLVAAARSGVRPEDEGFLFEAALPRALLLLPDDRWREVVAERTAPAAVTERVARIRRSLTTPAGSFEAPLFKADPLGLATALPGLASASGGMPVDPLTSTFLAEDGATSLVIVQPAQSEIDAAGGRELLALLDRTFAQVRQEAEGPLELHALGGPLYAAQDEALLRGDLERTLTTSALGCALVLVAAFEGIVLPLVCLAALAVALVWGAGLVGLSLGGVTGISVGFAAVIVGLGIDYGIHGATRFRQRLLVGEPPGTALVSTFERTGPGILTSALTTAVAFGVLALAHFRPLRELGVVVASGMLVVLAGTAVVGGALLALLPPPRRRRPGVVWRALGRGVGWLVVEARRHPRLVLALAAVLTAAAAVGLTGLRLDPDLRALRPVDHPALAGERLLVERFGLGLDTATVAVPGASRGEALARAAEITELLRREAPPGVTLTSPADWLPGEERRRARLEVLARGPGGAALSRAVDQLEAELRGAGLNPAAFRAGLAALRDLAVGKDPSPSAESPDWLDELVRVGPDGAWVAIALRLPSGTWADGAPPGLLAEIRRIAPGAAFASAVAIGPELRSLAARDLETLSAWALAAVALVVLLSFRGDWRATLLSMVPVTAASLWTLGGWALAGHSLDLVSLAVVPVMIGIGIDDGLHAVHGARRGGLAASVEGAGRAMALTTLTTVVGFGSLMLSRVPGLSHGGSLVALGVVASLLATLTLLPALEAVRRR
ncbi:MAG: MMPL family transporter [Acidobacteria bacterium]|nr:MMPL family transporter [Acidobacteriota bacterium]